MAVQSFSRDALVETAWKNGAGRTREIVSWPPGASIAAFAWRASLATLDRDARFSTFDGVDRSIVLIDGDAVTLTAEDGASHALARDVPYAFDGEAAIHCAIGAGASTDFNVMTRRAAWTHDVAVIGASTTIASSAHGVLMALAGTWTVDDATLAPGEGLWWADVPTAWRATTRDAGARLLALRCERR